LNSAEDPSSFGSHFLINGNEKLVRLLQMQRKNHPLALNRAAYTNRGKGYTTLGVTVRCGKTGGRVGTVSNTVHYKADGGVTLRILVRKKEVLLPVVTVLRALSHGAYVNSSVGGVGGVGGGRTTTNSSSNSSSSNSNSTTNNKSTGISDAEIYSRLTSTSPNSPPNTFLTSRCLSLLKSAPPSAQTSLQSLEFIGR
tara:strand:- start:121 stop:711 length:591 start_codon:yes stop_codon:yes gene_type:complete